MSSDSSSDEENLDLLREAADHQFINDSMFNGGHQRIDEKTINIEKSPSLRPSKQDDQFDVLGVTPEFQAYVARQLANNLEKRLSMAHVITDVKETPSERPGGIKLFKESKHFIKTESEVHVETIKVKKRPLEVDTEDEQIKFKIVSVTPESILNKADTAFWSDRSKAPVFRYRKAKNGQLISIDGT